MPAPTYWTETTADGQMVYHCAYCKEQGSEHHSSDEALFIQHMEQRHDGRMVEDTDASAAARTAPDDHPQGSPPGQAEEGEPTDQIVDPDAPYVEHDEEPKP